MRIKILIFFVCITIVSTCFISCDDTTETIGTSLTDNLDVLKITTDTFTLTSRSIIADSVLARNTTGYLGKVKDPETGAYLTGDFMAQFATLEDYEFPEKDSIVSLIDGEIVADSCDIRLYYESYFGDSLATMNISVYEMDQAMSEGEMYYSNFDPMEKGLVREGGYKVDKTYTLSDLSVSIEDRSDADVYTPNIWVPLMQPYTDKDGVTYNNYGTYIMRKYYENPSNFRNSYNFIHDVCPGFYFKVNEGLGAMAYVFVSQINVYFRYQADSTFLGTSKFSATEEVLQTTNISNDDKTIEALASDNTCTYLKTPSGIFTELTLPVDEIMLGHENDTINTAKVVLQRLNNEVHGEYTLDIPETLMMIPKDSLYKFFENKDIVDYKRSFLASYSSSYNNYSFNNISGMITFMNRTKLEGLSENPSWVEEHPDWNKVVIIPVSLTLDSSSVIMKVVHDMSLSSTRLIGGSENPYDPIKISVIYSKYSYD